MSLLLLRSPALSLGFIILGEIFLNNYTTIFLIQLNWGSRIPSSWMVHAGCVFGTGIHLSRTWMSGSLEFVWWNACVHRLDIGLYSHPKEFGEYSQNPCKLQGKSPLHGKDFPQRRIEPTTLHQAGQQAQHTTNELVQPLAVSETVECTGSSCGLTSADWQYCKQCADRWPEVLALSCRLTVLQAVCRSLTWGAGSVLQTDSIASSVQMADVLALSCRLTVLQAVCRSLTWGAGSVLQTDSIASSVQMADVLALSCRLTVLQAVCRWLTCRLCPADWQYCKPCADRWRAGSVLQTDMVT